MLIILYWTVKDLSCSHPSHFHWIVSGTHRATLFVREQPLKTNICIRSHLSLGPTLLSLPALYKRLWGKKKKTLKNEAASILVLVLQCHHPAVALAPLFFPHGPLAAGNTERSGCTSVHRTLHIRKLATMSNTFTF